MSTSHVPLFDPDTKYYIPTKQLKVFRDSLLKNIQKSPFLSVCRNCLKSQKTSIFFGIDLHAPWKFVPDFIPSICTQLRDLLCVQTDIAQRAKKCICCAVLSAYLLDAQGPTAESTSLVSQHSKKLRPTFPKRQTACERAAWWDAKIPRMQMLMICPRRCCWQLSLLCESC